MEKAAVYYGSSMGNTQDVAMSIAKKLNISDVYDVALVKADFAAYDVLLFGVSTWGIGDLQDDWEGFISKVKSADLNGKKIAIFGCGDSASYSDSFCDAMAKIYNEIKDKGCIIIGKTSTDGYSFNSSEAVVGGVFIGLAIDQDNEESQTNSRIDNWINQLKSEI